MDGRTVGDIVWPPPIFMDKPPDVIADITDNETWNTCPSCGHDWKDEVATPGLIHRTRLCARCVMRTEHGRPQGNRIH